MFILRDLLTPLQQPFSATPQGQKRKTWFVYTLLAVIIPFTSSKASNLLRSLQTLWSLIHEPAVNGRILLALDDSINIKTGRRIFGCAHFHDHAARGNQTAYPWSQCILAIGLLKRVKSRWVCLPLDFRFYFMKKTIEEQRMNAQRQGKTVAFKSKLEQAAVMIQDLFVHFSRPVLVVTDSWFGNDGLWNPASRKSSRKLAAQPVRPAAPMRSAIT